MTRPMMVVAPLLLLSSLAAAAEPQPLSLRDAVNYALQHSPDLRLSRMEIERREGLAASAGALRWPQLDLAADAARSSLQHGYPAGTVPSQLRYDTTLYSGSADLKWLLWDFDKTGLELAATRERVEAARAIADRRQQEIVFETARLYLQTLAYGDLAAAAEARVKSLQSLLDRTNQLVEAGRAVPVDALKIHTRLAQVESDLATLGSGRRSSLSALASVMGLDGDLPKLASSEASGDSPEPSGAESDLLAQANASRPELRAQDYEIRASSESGDAIRKSAWPRIDLRASVIRYGSNNPVGFPQLIGSLLPGLSSTSPPPSGGASDWVVGVHASFSLFDGGKRDGQFRSAQAQLEQARVTRELLQLRITREVRTALADLESAEARVRSLRDSVTESERVLHDERLKFEAGRSVVNFVLDAESALLTNQSLLSQALRSVSTASLALDLSLGRIDIDRLPKP